MKIGMLICFELSQTFNLGL